VAQSTATLSLGQQQVRLTADLTELLAPAGLRALTADETNITADATGRPVGKSLAWPQGST
jgi:hypothetical protein